ncbi:DUF4097 family beta strand repeat-containing protein [Pseudonocardia sp. 73-21]|uniref:DUF4097 family beta strand repeat-containing protein n=1 Tax=Pseudonocardia sp. 73-21 TaxID=1895809 RepID=UPI000966E36F|nr:DUF4097 family beta strand repeat-containing protein [Pseudonocardia sp. 73-21]OJY42696.1 MAG: hypothetical protein BGP03_28260 [Pseudonocardia sp. 73-21]
MTTTEIAATTSTFLTPVPVTAVVQVAGARVRVTAGDRTDAEVLVRPVAPASRADVRVAEKTRVTFVDGRLTVRTTVSGARNGSVSITIGLPAGSHLVAYTARSTVRADGALGDVELHTAQGRFALDRVDELRTNIANGEVTVGRVAGSASIDGSAVVVRIGEVTGAGRVSNSGGQTWIGHACADDGVTARTADGAIRIGRLTRDRTDLSNCSGTIEIVIGEDATLSLDADSTRGTVRSSVAAQDDGTVALRARTRHGDVVVHPAAL